MKTDEVKPSETEELPPEEVVEEVVETPSAEDEAEKRAHELEIENARLKGRQEVLEAAPKVAGTDPNAWKQVVWQDMGNMSEDAFLEKYKIPKHQASTQILSAELKETDSKTRQQVAELRAENKLAAKYADFFERRGAVEEAIRDMAPEARQDPERLAKAMERAYLASVSENPKVEKKAPPAKRIVEATLERPAASGTEPKPKADKGEIPAEYRQLAREFGIESEAERQALMKNDYVEMDFGGGVILRDPEKGFERKTA